LGITNDKENNYMNAILKHSCFLKQRNPFIAEELKNLSGINRKKRQSLFFIFMVVADSVFTFPWQKLF
jgi:hypothetical protein